MYYNQVVLSTVECKDLCILEEPFFFAQTSVPGDNIAVMIEKGSATRSPRLPSLLATLAKICSRSVAHGYLLIQAFFKCYVVYNRALGICCDLVCFVSSLRSMLAAINYPTKSFSRAFRKKKNFASFGQPKSLRVIIMAMMSYVHEI